MTVRAYPATLLAMLLVLSAPGCRTAHKGSRAAAAASSHWQPNRLLLSDARYRGLHVEIDAVEGTAPTPADIASLKQFLTRHCRKPDGIKIQVDDVLPRADAQGRLSRQLAIEHMDGPPDDQSAYLYILFYDSKISPEEKSQPVCLLTPYHGAIFVDHQYVRPRIRRMLPFRERVLLHEAGHALGLCRSADHSDGLHCENENCLMNPSLHFSVLRLIFGGDLIKQTEFCADCLRDLKREQQARPAANLRYLGPWLVRSEAGYHVITRPNMLYVHIGELAELDHTELDALRELALKKTRKTTGLTYSCAATDRETALQALDAMRQDPVKAVHEVADSLARKLTEDRPDALPPTVDSD